MLTIGVVGVPRIGRLWRTIEVDLADVHRWTIEAKPRTFPFVRRSGRRPAAPTGQNVNSVCGPGGRYLLRVEVAQSSVHGTGFPEFVMVGYALQRTAEQGYGVGPIIVRARRHESLRAALDAALPGGAPPMTTQTSAPAA